MKKQGILNRDIAGVLAKMGHTDQLVIADCGLPIPPNVLCIDLSLKQGIPSFLDVLNEITNDMVVEKIILAEEIKTKNVYVHDDLRIKLGTDIKVDYVTHEDFKLQLKHVKAIIRTGETTPYANVILQSGVIF
ncbi:D-ribose pyranase [Paenalkalicoccus suaedae]|uniref:D-ribose pyranase n=1 Tax=Paenalkalicoccus suaedae TaxID=2592382 RepID=A0A859FI70_9BACI|nr:D-ribose pyranase [Paenalkalicoccus suaedae]QKS72548.1 D-ribose pyranase [Paenalkalicoccus suaedae]